MGRIAWRGWQVALLSLLATAVNGYSLNHCKSGFTQLICEFQAFTVGITGVLGTEQRVAIPGAELWTNQGYQATLWPASLQGAKLISFPYESIGQGTTISVTVNKAAVIYIVFEDNALKDGGFGANLPAGGEWTELVNSLIIWGDGQTLLVYERAVQPGTYTLPAITTTNTVMDIIVKRTGVPGNDVEGTIQVPGLHFPQPHASITWIVYKCDCDSIAGCTISDTMDDGSVNAHEYVETYYGFYAGVQPDSPTTPHTSANAAATTLKLDFLDNEYQTDNTASSRTLVSDCVQDNAAVFDDYVVAYPTRL